MRKVTRKLLEGKLPLSQASRDHLTRQRLAAAEPVPESLEFDFSDLPPLAPRNDNNGAQISIASTLVKIDFLDFALKVPDLTWDRCAKDILGLDPNHFVSADFGLKGMPCQECHGLVRILHDPNRPERGIKVLLSSQALDEVAIDAIDIAAKVIELGGTFTRIDLALDDRQGRLDVPVIFDLCKAGYLVTRFHKFEPLVSYDAKTGQQLPGMTVYFGSDKSNRFAYCYDKRQERIDKGEPDPGHWVRFELRALKSSACELAGALVSYGLDSAPAILRAVIDFRELDNENQSRRTPCQWWNDFLAVPGVIRTGVRKVAKTIEEKSRWLSKQVKRTMGQVAVILGTDYLASMVQEGIDQTPVNIWHALSPSINLYSPIGTRQRPREYFRITDSLREQFKFPLAAVPF